MFIRLLTIKWNAMMQQTIFLLVYHFVPRHKYIITIAIIMRHVLPYVHLICLNNARY